MPHNNNTCTRRYVPTGKHELPNCNLCWPDHTDTTGQAQSAIHPNAADRKKKLTKKTWQPGYAEVWRKTYRQCMRNKLRCTLFQTVYTLPLFYVFWFNAPCQWSLLKLRPIISVQRPSAGSALTLIPLRIPSFPRRISFLIYALLIYAHFETQPGREIKAWCTCRCLNVL